MRLDAKQPVCAATVVCIAGGDGSLGPLMTILRALPDDFPLPVVVGIHRCVDVLPVGTARVVAKLQDESALDVSEAHDQEALERAHVFFAPAGAQTSLSAAGISVAQKTAASLDTLLASAVEAYGAGVIAVVLSGSDLDGAQGIRLVSQVGGTVILQEPITASHSALIELLTGEHLAALTLAPPEIAEAISVIAA